MKKLLLLGFALLYFSSNAYAAVETKIDWSKYFNESGLAKIKSFEYSKFDAIKNKIIVNSDIRAKLREETISAIDKITDESNFFLKLKVDSEIESLGIYIDAHKKYILEFKELPNINIKNLSKNYTGIFYQTIDNQKKYLDLMFDAYKKTNNQDNKVAYGLAFSDAYSVFGSYERLGDDYQNRYLEINPNSINVDVVENPLLRSTTSGSYNGATAASWAISNALKSEKEYRSLLNRPGYSQYIPYMDSGDCTNFVSGAMWQGGLNMNSNWQLRLKSGKNLNSFKTKKMKDSEIGTYFDYNASWFNADKFRLFWTDSTQKTSYYTRTFASYVEGYFSGPKEADYYNSFKVGDIFSFRNYNYTPAHNGQPASYYAGKSMHTTIIIKKYTNKHGYKDWMIAQHTTDKKDVEFYEWLKGPATEKWGARSYLQITQID